MIEIAGDGVDVKNGDGKNSGKQGWRSRVKLAVGPISLYRTDPTTSQTYTLLNAVPNIGIYIDMGDKSPQVLQNNVPYQYSVSDGVTTLSFTVTLPPNPVAEATYENLLYSLSRIIEAAIQTTPFPTSPTGTPDPLTNKAIVYMTLPMTENIKTPAIFVNQELLKMDDFPVGGLTEIYREFYSGTPSLFTRVFSITILDVNSASPKMSCMAAKIVATIRS